MEDGEGDVAMDDQDGEDDEEEGGEEKLGRGGKRRAKVSVLFRVGASTDRSTHRRRRGQNARLGLRDRELWLDVGLTYTCGDWQE